MGRRWVINRTKIKKKLKSEYVRDWGTLDAAGDIGLQMTSFYPIVRVKKLGIWPQK